MRLVVISPESDEPREHAVMAALFASGLERYHVRKPTWAQDKMENWLSCVPARWWGRLVLHQHHELVWRHGLGGVHYRGSDVPTHPSVDVFTSCSCHDLAGLEASLGKYDSVFFSPVFPSISKPGYRPATDFAVLSARLERRTADEHKTAVMALGGVTPENAGRCADLGFDGVALLGALWHAGDPLHVFKQVQQSLAAYAA